MRDGCSYDDQLEAAIANRIRQDLSPRHVPKFIFETPDIPITVNGKKTEAPVKKIVCGKEVTPSSTIINPESLNWYKQFANLGSNVLERSLSKL
jgi:acetoacetyl-CoA synthetase